MKLLVLGASGMIGSRIAAEAVARGHEVTGTARNPEKIAEGVSKVALDMAKPDGLAALAGAADAVIVTISPRSSGDAFADMEQVAEAIEDHIAPSGTPIFHVGGAGTLNLPDGSPLADILPDEYRSEAQAMRKSYERLSQKGLDYTFIAPASLIAPGERTGQYRTSWRQAMAAPDGSLSTISAEDYAVAMLDEVETGARRGTAFQVAN
ncbi:NAD(P)-dependent oxidoreductase [Nioella aestuarii]|uniref:NAD(P)-dependent oxidoreductase n=1 Tax=Nioella aestuarii TaxID=1662864 RepID=UPI003D7FF2BD